MAANPKTTPEARLSMMELANMISVPMALTAVIRLNIPNLIWASGANAPLSAAHLLPASPSPLERLLRLLSSHNVFHEHLDFSSSSAGAPTRKYSLTPVGLTLVGPNSFSPYVLQHHQDALLRAWFKLDAAVADPEGPEAFSRANGGMRAYEYYGEDSEANELMQRAMEGVSVPFMEVLLEGYGEEGFGGVRKLVDVGGSSGACLDMIMKKFPNVEVGVNFDLPAVVAEAPAYPGVTHVGGDMFKSIPEGDAIFMKWVLTTWTDDECTLILKNCHKALPDGGKVIACEPVLPEETDSSQRTRALLEGDIFVMATYRTLGKERSEKEFRQLGVAAGFPKFRAIYLDPFYTILEYQK